MLASLTLTSVLMYIVVVQYCTSAFSDYKNNTAQYQNFAKAAYWTQQWKNVNAVLLFVLMLVVS